MADRSVRTIEAAEKYVLTSFPLFGALVSPSDTADLTNPGFIRADGAGTLKIIPHGVADAGAITLNVVAGETAPVSCGGCSPRGRAQPRCMSFTEARFQAADGSRARNRPLHDQGQALRAQIRALLLEHSSASTPLTAKRIRDRLACEQSVRTVQWHMSAIRRGYTE